MFHLVDETTNPIEDLKTNHILMAQGPNDTTQDVIISREFTMNWRTERPQAVYMAGSHEPIEELGRPQTKCSARMHDVLRQDPLSLERWKSRKVYPKDPFAIDGDAVAVSLTVATIQDDWFRASRIDVYLGHPDERQSLLFHDIPLIADTPKPLYEERLSTASTNDIVNIMAFIENTFPSRDAGVYRG